MMIAMRQGFVRHKTQGFSLLELLLVISLMAVFLMGLINVFDKWSQRTMNRVAAAEILRLQSAAVRYIKNNFGSFEGDAFNVFTPIPLSELADGVYLPSGYTPRNPFRQTMRVYKRKMRVARLEPDGTPTADLVTGAPLYTTVFEVLTITDDPSATNKVRISNQNLMDIVQAGGPRMGVYSQITTGGIAYAGRITSPLQDWYITYTPGMLDGYLGQPDARAGYLAAYEIVSTSNLVENDNYLYRVDIPGRPELNQMRADLRMDLNPIQKVGNLTADRVNVAGNAAFLGRGGASDNTNALTIDQALRLNNAGEHRINMKTPSGGCSFTGLDANNNRDVVGTGCVISGGEVQVISSGDATLDIANSLRMDGSIITDNTRIGSDASHMTEAYGTSTFNTVTGNNLQAHERVVAPDVYVSGNVINTQRLTAGNVGLYDTNAATGGFRGSGGVTAAQLLLRRSDTASPHYNMTTQRLELGNLADFRRGNVIADGADVTHGLDVTTIQTGVYRDTVVGHSGRNVRCTQWGANNKVYCEPQGLSRHQWLGNWYELECTIIGNGYTCTDYVLPAGPTGARGARIATCTYPRVNDSGPARHASPINCDFAS